MDHRPVWQQTRGRRLCRDKDEGRYGTHKETEQGRYISKDRLYPGCSSRWLSELRLISPFYFMADINIIRGTISWRENGISMASRDKEVVSCGDKFSMPTEWVHESCMELCGTSESISSHALKHSLTAYLSAGMTKKLHSCLLFHTNDSSQYQINTLFWHLMRMAMISHLIGGCSSPIDCLIYMA